MLQRYRTVFRIAGIASALTVLAACVAPPERTAEPEAPTPRDWLMELKAEVSRGPSNIHVLPLEEPAVADLRTAGETSATRGAYAESASSFTRALALNANDPSLWQGLAEAELGARRFAEARTAAERATALAPNAGELCVRAWFALHAARVETGDATGAASAREKAVACQILPPPRY